MKTDTPPTVHRFPLAIEGHSKIEMPKGAIILEIAAVKGVPNIIAMVDPEASKAPRHFIMANSGQPIPHGWDLVHLRSIVTTGPLIHIFEVPSHIAKKLKLP